MAFVNDEDDESQQGAASSGIMAGNSASKTSGAAPATGSGWTNLQTYLGANKGKGADVANKITSNTQIGVNNAQDNASQWETTAKTGADSRTRQDLWSDKIKNDPTKVDQAGFNDWKTGGNYSGATNATEDQGYSSAYGGVQKAQNDVKLAGDAYGQQALAKQTFGKDRSYSTGQSLLDTFIARGDQAGKDQFKSFQDKNQGIGASFDKNVGNVNEHLKGANSRGQVAYDGVMGAIGDKSKGINSAAQGRADANTDKSRAYEHLNTSAPKTSWLTENSTRDKYIHRNTEYGADDEYTDADIAALNSLAGMDDDVNTNAGYKRGTDSQYVADTAGYGKYIQDSIDKVGTGKKATPGVSTSPAPTTKPITSPSPTAPLPVPVPVGPTPDPSPTAPLPVKVPVGPTPAPTQGPIPTTPSGAPIIPSNRPVMGKTSLGGTGVGMPGQDKTGNSTSTINYSGPKPAGWPTWMPWPPPGR